MCVCVFSLFCFSPSQIVRPLLLLHYPTSHQRDSPTRWARFGSGVLPVPVFPCRCCLVDGQAPGSCEAPGDQGKVTRSPSLPWTVLVLSLVTCVLVEFNSPIVLSWSDSRSVSGLPIFSRFMSYLRLATHGSKWFKAITVHSSWKALSAACVYINHTVVIAMCNLNQLTRAALAESSPHWKQVRLPASNVDQALTPVIQGADSP